MLDSRSSGKNKNPARANVSSQNNSNRPLKPTDKTDKNVNKKLTINTNLNSDLRNLSDDSDDQSWSTNNIKRIVSSGLSPKSKEPKISKSNTSKFSTPNRYEALSEEVTPDSMDTVEQTNVPSPTTPPPIFITTPVDFNDFCKSLLSITGENGFECKSSTKHLKLTTTKIEFYRLIIHLLNENKFEYFTYQVKADKPYRVVIRNLHPTTDTNSIKDELTSKGFAVRNISNIQARLSKSPLPLFFVDLDPAPENPNIFKLTSLCYTKIKVEEPHSRKDLPQCHRCQDYGHTKTYCNRDPRCVRCGKCHLSELCEKPRDTPASCALCGEAHPANYKGCIKHKTLLRSRNSKLKNFTQTSYYQHSSNPSTTSHANLTSSNISQQTNPNLVQTSPATRQNSYASATKGKTQSPINDFPPENPLSNQLTSFIHELQSLITPLITILSSLINKLVVTNDSEY